MRFPFSVKLSFGMGALTTPGDLARTLRKLYIASDWEQTTAMRQDQGLVSENVTCQKLAPTYGALTVMEVGIFSQRSGPYPEVQRCYAEAAALAANAGAIAAVSVYS